MLLSEIFEQAPSINITSLCSDSRQAKKGCMYFCLEGMVNDGHDFIDQAIQNGAISIVHSKEISEMKDGIAYIRVSSVIETMNQVASKFNGHPSEAMRVFGITGTNGKSTTTTLIRNILNHFSPCGYIGTIAIRYGDFDLEPEHTTPDALFLQKTLKEMVDAGMKNVALEVSSHGLEQGRVLGVSFDIVGFTNLTHEHMDYHGTIENYFQAKAKLFHMVNSNGVCVLNIDDKHYEALRKECRARIVTYGITKDCDYRADEIELHPTSTTFTLVHNDERYRIITNLVATYNISNLLCAIACICESGYSLKEIIPYLNKLGQVDGRMERIDEGQPFLVIVDYAHTPDGFEKIYEYAKAVTPHDRKIISVFGSAGKRDMKKRSVMGEIADRYSSLIYLTEEDPRDEDPKEIADDIKKGMKHANCVFIADRYDAIRTAIETANVSDTILILGKGDETFMDRKEGTQYYMGDHKAARHIINKYYFGNESE